MLKRAVLSVLVCLFSGGIAFADIDMSNVYAYPVPYNPKKSSMKAIKFDKGVWPSVSSIKMEVFDINGDSVTERTFTTAGDVQWNARNSSGKMVAPGMYIIKLSVEDSNGDFGKKIIRVLIAY
ncbi:MAG: T9SS type A sorting domain-containing protein [Spirochaetia bacterium]|jgi:hypothetical protein|nr:T9SS type A sorting domain-containing protein [Spirochaetia bacterium]